VLVVLLVHQPQTVGQGQIPFLAQLLLLAVVLVHTQTLLLEAQVVLEVVQVEMLVDK
jgi:hypothetical protein